ncbi:MAG: 4-alpha-glucanotransferase [Erysipelotrichaceae bacterium]|nr:4-alpha-glucanotransferase [Erysipelotrichaceae bacterium]
MRSSGILLPVSSLPGKTGIGTLGKEAYEFVDFLKAAGQTYWQVLPVGPTSYGDSPYQSFSTFAGNPYFIDFDLLSEEGLLKKEEYEDIDWGDKEDRIDYGKIYENRYIVLRKAYERFDIKNKEYIKFIKNNKWVDDYALFMSLKNNHEGKCFLEWEKEYIHRDKKKIDEYINNNDKDISFYRFIQYCFFKQWFELKKYANDKGIKIIGDCPIYVALDSVDVWSDPKLFLVDEDLKPSLVAGCPPDAFSDDGQLWGNPLYDWEYHDKTGYKWWIKRIDYALKMYDTLRIDHFIGFSSYYAIEYGRENGRIGKRYKGPGMKLFKAVKKAIPDASIIAEDLGVLDDDVRKLLKDCGFPGMKILMFAFGDRNPDNEYLPHNMIRNCVTYIGTHDNEPIMAYREMLDKKTYSYAKKYIGCKSDKNFNRDMIRTLESMVSDLCIIQAQDILGLGMEARMNLPSATGNWQWRLKENQLTKKDAKWLKSLAKMYGRIPKNK